VCTAIAKFVCLPISLLDCDRLTLLQSWNWVESFDQWSTKLCKMVPFACKTVAYCDKRVLQLRVLQRVQLMCRNLCYYNYLHLVTWIGSKVGLKTFRRCKLRCINGSKSEKNISKIAINILQGSVVTQVVLGSLTIQCQKWIYIAHSRSKTSNALKIKAIVQLQISYSV